MLSWDEIKTRATAFVIDWKDEARERGEAQTFWNAFLDVFGVNRKRVASFEAAVKKASGQQGYIDLFWPGVLIAEHKSRGKDLDSAHGQALDYFPGLSDRELPRYVIVSDFERFRLRDLETGEATEFALTDLLRHIERFGFIAGYEKRSYDEQDPVNVQAAAKMGVLHDALQAAGYDGHDLEVYLVRLLFCLFADDTGIFTPRGSFEEYLMDRTREDGSDLGAQLGALFEVLNTPGERRQTTLDEHLAAFPYVNGALFAEHLRTAHFNRVLRDQLLDACGLDWGAISPAIFGAMFQGAMDADERRSLGAHYTSEQNILKLIGPLFMDALRAEFERVRSNRRALQAFHQKLAGLRLLDPACGCGNFLVIAYRELRLLEIEVIRVLQQGQQVISVNELVLLNVDQCFGIEIEEFPAQIAQVALWLMDHQMNLKVAEAFGEYFTRLPLRRAAQIRHGNALTLDWNTCFGDTQPERFDYLFGNPPFVGKHYQSKAQRAELQAVFQGVKAVGDLDYVTGWYVKAAQYMQAHPATVTAFVSTNSISQGEQVGVLWTELFNRYKAKIHFAHRTFRWDNEASGMAAVHVVIIGFALFDIKGKRLFDYEDVRGEPHERAVSNINPYLVEGDDLVVLKRRTPLFPVPDMRCGNKPTDGGNLIFTQEECADFLMREPGADPFMRRYIGSEEFINGNDRYCLWLVGAKPDDLRRLPRVMERVQRVRAMREASTATPTQRAASTPTLFFYISQPQTEYLAIPEVSSERRKYIPMGFLPPTVIVSNKIFFIPSSSRYHLGVLSSAMHMAWVRQVSGRLESRYQYSGSVVYNTFPWPEAPSAKQRAAVEAAAQAVLDARQPHLDGGATLADLYDPLTMPPELVTAHRTLDRAVDRAYRPQPFTTETNRVAFLFERYEALTNVLFRKPGKRGRERE